MNKQINIMDIPEAAEWIKAHYGEQYQPNLAVIHDIIDRWAMAHGHVIRGIHFMYTVGHEATVEVVYKEFKDFHCSLPTQKNP